jgi:hypothetical protein
VRGLPACVPDAPCADRVDQQALCLFERYIGRLGVRFDDRGQDDLCRSARRAGGRGSFKNLVSGHRQSRARDPLFELWGKFPTSQACRSKIETILYDKGFAVSGIYSVTRSSRNNTQRNRLLISAYWISSLNERENSDHHGEISFDEFAEMRALLTSNRLGSANFLHVPTWITPIRDGIW